MIYGPWTDSGEEELGMQEQTLGDRRVRASFNPAKDNKVDAIKHATASLIDLCEEMKSEKQGSDSLRLLALAQTAYEEATYLYKLLGNGELETYVEGGKRMITMRSIHERIKRLIAAFKNTYALAKKLLSKFPHKRKPGVRT